MQTCYSLISARGGGGGVGVRSESTMFMAPPEHTTFPGLVAMTAVLWTMLVDKNICLPLTKSQVQASIGAGLCLLYPGGASHLCPTVQISEPIS